MKYSNLPLWRSSQWITDNNLVMLPRMICYWLTNCFARILLVLLFFVCFQRQEFVDLPPLSFESNTFSRIVAIRSVSRRWCSGTALNQEVWKSRVRLPANSPTFICGFWSCMTTRENKYHSGPVMTVVVIYLYSKLLDGGFVASCINRLS